ncbi:MAG: acyl-CoA dehydrogenase family protein [Solirubrobacteraceae bacterium]
MAVGARAESGQAGSQIEPGRSEETPVAPVASWETHAVVNQVPPLEHVNLFAANVPLVEATEREGAGWALERAHALGALAGGEPLRWGEEANSHHPVLRTHDRVGRRIDEVEFHPAWHRLMRMGVENELHALPWRSPQPARHVARAALFMTAIQAEAGFACPITMTFAVIPALRRQPELAAEWEPLITATSYDPELRPAAEKGSAIAGMGMTEKQGGSDVRANTTTALPKSRFGLGDVGGGPGGEYELVGHKWFCSAPMSDLFLVLAQAPEGLSCFLLPRVLPDGTANAFHIQRLKDKLGNRSNASGEIELNGAWARMVGEPGRGVATIIEMVAHTRLDCAIGAAGLMHLGVLHAAHHARHRRAFGKLLAEQPLMRNVLADLCVESEAATALAMRLARAYDEAESVGGGGAGASAAGGDATAQAPELFRRLATAVGKYWVCKRAPNHTFEAMECLGGNGYVEDSGLPRLYREAPVMSIWEGTGNVMALDVLRALARSPEAAEIFLAECEEAAGGDRRLDEHVRHMREELAPLRGDGDGDALEGRARSITEGLALALEGSLLVRHAPSAVADAFCASRLSRAGGLEYGTLPAGSDVSAILARAGVD